MSKVEKAYYLMVDLISHGLGFSAAFTKVCLDFDLDANESQQILDWYYVDN